VSLLLHPVYNGIIVLHSFHHNDGIIHHNTDGQYKGEHGQVVDRKAKHWKKMNVPMMDTASANMGINVALQL
jgi:hypothetical protein